MSKSEDVEIAADSSNPVNVPEHLIIDQILPRLPVKTLIRFKLVSKLWLSTISNRQFAKSHLNISSSSSSGQFLLLIKNKINHQLLLLPYDELNNLKTPLDLGYSLYFDRNVQGVHIVGSSNGLVCLHIVMFDEYIKFRSFFCVCNPATKECCEINNLDGEQVMSLSYWFGYISSIGDYRSIFASFRLNGIQGYRFYLYSLRIGKWKIINDLEGNCNWLYDRLYDSTTVFDDVLYWSPTKPHSLGRPKRIIGFDLVNEKLKEVPFMDWLNQYDAANFFVMNGCLSLLCCSSCQKRDVWTMRKHDDWSSWEKSFSFPVEDEFINTVTPTGKFLLRRHSQRFKIIGFNKNTQELSQGDAYIPKGKIILVSATGYVESLISPFGMNNRVR